MSHIVSGKFGPMVSYDDNPAEALECPECHASKPASDWPKQFLDGTAYCPDCNATCLNLQKWRDLGAAHRQAVERDVARMFAEGLAEALRTAAAEVRSDSRPGAEGNATSLEAIAGIIQEATDEYLRTDSDLDRQGSSGPVGGVRPPEGESVLPEHPHPDHPGAPSV